MAGKGDKPRPVNYVQYRANYDKAFKPVAKKKRKATA